MIDTEFFKTAPEDFKKLYLEILESRTLNPAQKEILHAFFHDGCGRIFLRIGRKGSKTASIIMVAWLFAHFRPKCMIHILYPSLEQAFDVVWEEERIQLCDLKTPTLKDNWVADIDEKKMTITFKNGSKIRILGTWAKTRGRGVQPDLMIADEIQDCNPGYLNAADPNLIAKPDSRFILSGTPPRKRNHYHEWEKRTLSLYSGKHLHYSSYINTSLPHLAKELDKKRDELIASGKEDEWIREYLAEDCFSSEDRILPDPKFADYETLLPALRAVHHTHRTHIIGLHITQTTICAVFGIMEKSSNAESKIYILDYILRLKLWDGSYREIYNQLPEMCENLTSVPFTSWRKWVFDNSNSFIDVIPGFTKSTCDKGNERGFPLMRELMHTDRLILSDKTEAITLEMQNLLKGDDFNTYPLCSAIAIVVNEHYQESRRKPGSTREVSDQEKICDMLNLRPPPKRERGESFIKYNWGN